jgi:hypothetical protein
MQDAAQSNVPQFSTMRAATTAAYAPHPQLTLHSLLIIISPMKNNIANENLA